ncbi:hypothetical protein [Rhizobium sp. BK176]|uniref:hypothetical protein n=1 Tax=Rhizobium sp. BK176 TaxID=2587071 RepID=UPI0021676F58|nr:hypothetical protein [Rhizobium sp. BK176]MCS4089285.1 hypothetical protein [Rhizobium sp. BK176]
MELNATEVDRIDFRELKTQDEGEMFIFHNEHIKRAVCFITDPDRYFTDEEASDIMYGRRTWGEVVQSKKAATGALN